MVLLSRSCKGHCIAPPSLISLCHKICMSQKGISPWPWRRNGEAANLQRPYTVHPLPTDLQMPTSEDVNKCSHIKSRKGEAISQLSAVSYCWRPFSSTVSHPLSPLQSVTLPTCSLDASPCASCCTLLLYFSRFCTVRLKFCFLCIICVKLL